MPSRAKKFCASRNYNCCMRVLLIIFIISPSINCLLQVDYDFGSYSNQPKSFYKESNDEVKSELQLGLKSDSTSQESGAPKTRETLLKELSDSARNAPTISSGDNNEEDGLCTLSTVSRLSLIPGRLNVEIAERVLTCSRIGENNYRQIVKNIYKRSKLNINQIEITDSESLVVFSVIDLICDWFNCSKLTVFNVTGHEIHDCNVLSYWINSWPQLEILDLSNTSLKSIESIVQEDGKHPSSVIWNLTSLHLDDNNVSILNFNEVLRIMPSLKQLSLVNNTIFNISCNENLRTRVRSQFESISLAGNAINCDKSYLWFMKLLQNSLTNFKFPDHDQIKCGAPERLAEMTWNQRVSVLETKICDYCECRSLKKTAISVDCHNRNITVLPSVLPLNTKILNLTCNQISSLDIPNNSKNWENVTYVYLQDNLITSLQPLEVNSKFLRNLAALDIRKNKFREFPSHIFERFINLDQVHLSNNPWLCDCEPTFAFQEWLQRQFHKVGDKEGIMCGISGSDENGVRSFSLEQRLSSRVIYRLSKSELCPQDNLEEPYDWLDMVNLTLGLTIFMIALKVTLDYIYLQRTKRLPEFFKLNF